MDQKCSVEQLFTNKIFFYAQKVFVKKLLYNNSKHLQYLVLTLYVWKNKKLVFAYVCLTVHYNFFFFITNVRLNMYLWNNRTFFFNSSIVFVKATIILFCIQIRHTPVLHYYYKVVMSCRRGKNSSVNNSYMLNVSFVDFLKYV